MVGEFDVDVQDGNDLGHFVLNDDGHFQVGGECCKVCTVCGVDGLDVAFPQPNAVVTVAGACADADCAGAEDVYEFSNCFDLDGSCHWFWYVWPDPPLLPVYQLHLIFCKVAEEWAAFIIRGNAWDYANIIFGNDDACPCGGVGDFGLGCGDLVTGRVACSGEVVTGTFELSGTNRAAGDCTDCVATVTLG